MYERMTNMMTKLQQRQGGGRVYVQSGTQELWRRFHPTIAGGSVTTCGCSSKACNRQGEVE
jgi:hypothetical protein